jgi:hypothetical protein
MAMTSTHPDYDTTPAAWLPARPGCGRRDGKGEARVFGGCQKEKCQRVALIGGGWQWFRCLRYLLKKTGATVPPCKRTFRLRLGSINPQLSTINRVVTLNSQLAVKRFVKNFLACDFVPKVSACVNLRECWNAHSGCEKTRATVARMAIKATHPDHDVSPLAWDLARAVLAGEDAVKAQPNTAQPVSATVSLAAGDYKNIFKKIAARWKIPLSIYIGTCVVQGPGETAYSGSPTV